MPTLPSLTDFTDLIARQCRVMVQLSFAPTVGLLRATGLGSRVSNRIDFSDPTDDNGKIISMSGRPRNDTVALTLEATPGLRILLDQYYRLELPFQLSYEMFGDGILPSPTSFSLPSKGNPAVPVDFGTAVDCKILSLRCDDISHNSDDAVTLTVEILIGEWLV